MLKRKARLLKALSDETRLKIVQALLGGEMCACTLVPASGKAQPTVSQHLKVLLQSGILESRRDGVNIWYKLKSPEAARIMDVLRIPKTSRKGADC
ncbi:MAG: metalloregulator ArsR/SmtB family transcription factor [Candidatus Marsarchaeota archaeon]|nr:metalloregulator ArsR/SmtB family transcription factor [Candidatus Marsarchaeota archaeon]